MPNHNTADSTLSLAPVAENRQRAPRTRNMRATQDDVPYRATERREPRRAAVALERAQACARIADDNRGQDILLLDLRESTPLVDFFVIVTATSRRQSHAMAGEIDQAMKKCGEAKLGIEGSEEGRWTLIDYGDFVVHVFSPEDRAYYALEEIWGDAPQLDWQALPSPNHERS
jgi:ribosome-associated protein